MRSSPRTSSPTGRMRTLILGVGLQAIEENPRRTAPGRCAQHRSDDGGKLLPKRSVARHPEARERLQQRNRVGVRRERLDDGELGGERIAVLDRVAQRRCRDRQPRGAVAAGGGRTQEGLHVDRWRPSACRSRCLSRGSAAAASARRDIAAALSASDFVAFSAALRRPSTTGSVNGARGAACALSRARRAAMSSSVALIAWGSTLAGAGRAARSFNCFSNRSQPRAQIRRRIAAAARRTRRRATAIGPRASRRPRRPIAALAWDHDNCCGKNANGGRRSGGGFGSGRGGSSGGSCGGCGAAALRRGGFRRHFRSQAGRSRSAAGAGACPENPEDLLRSPCGHSKLDPIRALA